MSGVGEAPANIPMFPTAQQWLSRAVTRLEASLTPATELYVPSYLMPRADLLQYRLEQIGYDVHWASPETMLVRYWSPPEEALI